MNSVSRIFLPFIALLLLSSLATPLFAQEKRTIRIGSKKFTESVILGDIADLVAKKAGYDSIHNRDLGGTRILWNALLNGELDLYAEYTGTLTEEILILRRDISNDELRSILKKKGLRMTDPLGFNNTYVIGMKEKRAQKLKIRTISDLAAHPDLRFGFGNEFMERRDGWPGLRKAYALPQTDVRGMDHDLAYRGIESGSIDAMDLYSTDAEIEYYGLRSLVDERHFFPAYNAVFLYRAELETEAPDLIEQLKQLEGKLSEKKMRHLNALVKLKKRKSLDVAASFLEETFAETFEVERRSPLDSFLRNTLDHLLLTGISLSAAILIAIPLGIFAYKSASIGQIIIGVVGILQTVPSLAMFVFMIPLFGIGGPPAIMALFLYSLLPIVRNTYAGLHGIEAGLMESAIALGLSPSARMRIIELPLASRSILAGIKISAVINVGTATLGALIGAGGYGQPILTGIRLDDTALILQGAIPAALLALFVQGLFELAERLLTPRGMRRNGG